MCLSIAQENRHPSSPSASDHWLKHVVLQANAPAPKPIYWRKNKHPTANRNAQATAILRQKHARFQCDHWCGGLATRSQVKSAHPFAHPMPCSFHLDWRCQWHQCRPMLEPQQCTHGCYAITLSDHVQPKLRVDETADDACCERHPCAQRHPPPSPVCLWCLDRLQQCAWKRPSYKNQNPCIKHLHC